MKLLVLLAVIYSGTTSAFPMKLLKVPKIYNALITTNQKLLPSEAFPASTGTVFEPIGLSGDPVLLNPEAFSKEQPSEEGEAPRPFSKEGKKPTPVVFYPRYNVYHQLPQSIFPYHDVYQPPPIVVPVQRTQAHEPAAGEAPTEPEQSPAVPSAPAPVRPQGFGYVANNRPSNAEIPSVPPPPPPIGAPRPQEQTDNDDDPR